MNVLRRIGCRGFNWGRTHQWVGVAWWFSGLEAWGRYLESPDPCTSPARACKRVALFRLLPYRLAQFLSCGEVQ